jgi:hypothetical protein
MAERWQRTLWREWRQTGDGEFAARLLRVLGAEPAGVLATLTLLPIGAVLGAMLAAVLGLLVLNAPQWDQVPAWQFFHTTLLAWVRAGAWAGAGAMLLLRLLAGRTFTTTWWLSSLLAWPLAHVQLLVDFFRFLWFLWITAFRLVLFTLLVGLGVGLAYLALETLRVRETYGIAVNIVGISILLALLVNDVVKAVKEKRLAWPMVALLVGLLGAVPVYLLGHWRALGPYGAVVLLGIESSVWLHALIRDRFRERIYDRRFLWNWWTPRPAPAAVEAAMREACRAREDVRQAWGRVLDELAARKSVPAKASALTPALSHAYWAERYQARQLLAHLGGPAMEGVAGRLREPAVATDARWLLAAISADTRRRLAHKAKRLLCPHCLAKCTEQQVMPAAGRRISYYGCRLCQQSQTFIEGEAVLVLDDRMAEERTFTDGVFLVNALRTPTFCDCDRILITRASEYEVERFCIRMGNDTDPFRTGRHKRLPVTVCCALPENSRRILGSLFGKVTVVGEGGRGEGGGRC